MSSLLTKPIVQHHHSRVSPIQLRDFPLGGRGGGGSSVLLFVYDALQLARVIMSPIPTLSILPPACGLNESAHQVSLVLSYALLSTQQVEAILHLKIQRFYVCVNPVLALDIL